MRLSFELFVLGDQTGPDAFKVDDVGLTAVPETAAYGLVAGAGLIGFAVWRRRGMKARAKQFFPSEIVPAPKTGWHDFSFHNESLVELLSSVSAVRPSSCS